MDWEFDSFKPSMEMIEKLKAQGERVRKGRDQAREAAEFIEGMPIF